MLQPPSMGHRTDAKRSDPIRNKPSSIPGVGERHFTPTRPFSAMTPDFSTREMHFVVFVSAEKVAFWSFVIRLVLPFRKRI